MNKFYEKKEKKIKNKLIDTNNKLLTGFLKSDSYLGAFSKDLHIHNYRYIYGNRSKRTFINLTLTVHAVKRAFLIIGKLLKLRLKKKQKAKILIVCNSANTKKFYQAFKLTPLHNQIVYLHEDWVGGFITNPLLLNARLKRVGLIIGLNETHDNLLIHAARIYGVPFISVTNTHMNSNLITYPIMINTTNIESTFFLTFLLKKYLTNLNL